MKIKNNRILLLAPLFGFTLAAALAQTGSPAPDNVSSGRMMVRSDAGSLPVLPQMFDPATTADLFNDKVVKNSPLAAEFQSETVRLLPNNTTQVANRVTTLVYRDKDGRTRREQRVQGANATSGQTGGTTTANPSIEIYDAVAGFGYTLYAATKTAVRYKLPANAQRPAHVWDRVPQNTELLSNDRYAINQTRRYQIAPPAIEMLGTQLIFGAQAIGKRFTTKIPANAMGNDLEIETVHEAWYSPELKMLVKSGTRNPKTGEHSFQMTKLTRADQPLSLFQVPADYRIVEMGARLTGTSPN